MNIFLSGQPESPFALSIAPHCLLAVFAIAAVGGCAAQGSSVMVQPSASQLGPRLKVNEEPRKDSHFPSHRELSQLATKPAPAVPTDELRVEAPGFELVGALPDVIVDMTPSMVTPETQSVHAFVSANAGRFSISEAMNCFARQVGALGLTETGRPSISLTRFFGARCGSTAQALNFTMLRGSVSSEMKTAKAVKSWSKSVTDQLPKLDLPASAVMGSAFVRGPSSGESGNNDAVFVVAWGQPKVRVGPIARTPLGATAVIEGELLVEGERLRAMVTRGRYRAADCVIDHRVVLPRFRLKCPVDKGDRQAWIDIVAFKPGRILGRSALTILVSPAAAELRTYRRTVNLSSTAQMSEPEAVRAALLNLVNRARKQAGLPPFKLAVAQSDLAQKLAPHFFGAAFFRTEVATVADRIVMGLRAGWAVPGGPDRLHW